MHEAEEQIFPEVSHYSGSYINLSKYRAIFLTEEITKSLSIDFAALLLYYDNISNEEIRVYINSPGGDVTALTAMIDVMKMIHSPIHTICIGTAASAAAVILSCGDIRSAYKNSTVMIHGIQCLFPLLGNDYNNNESYIDLLRKLNTTLIKTLADSTKKKYDKVFQDCSKDSWFTSQQALEYGLIDQII